MHAVHVLFSFHLASPPRTPSNASPLQLCLTANPPFLSLPPPLPPPHCSFARFVGILTLESFSSQALGMAVGAAAPSTSAALAIGPAVILVSIVFGGEASGAAGPLGMGRAVFAEG